jgi:hypothetical protein
LDRRQSDYSLVPKSISRSGQSREIGRGRDGIDRLLRILLAAGGADVKKEYILGVGVPRGAVRFRERIVKTDRAGSS